MARPSKLTPAQWAEVDRRLAEGEGVRALAAEFGVSPATISKRGVAKQSKRVQEIARQIADAQTALAELPPSQQYVALSLAEKLRSISQSLASAAELGAKTAHRLHALANSEVEKVDDADPLSTDSITALKGVGVLTKLANDSASTALNLLAANKETIKRLEDEGGEPEPGLPVGALSTEALAEIMRAKDAAVRG